MKKLLLIALSTVAVSAHAWEPEIYVGANGAAWQYDHSVASKDFTINSLEVVAGLRLTDYIGIEARFGAGMNTARSDKITGYDFSGDNPATPNVDESTPGRVTIDSYEVEAGGYGSFYFKPMISNEKATLYGLLGYTSIQIEQSGTQAGTVAGDPPPVNFDDTEGDLSYGIGVSFKMTERTEITAEWKKLINAADFDMRGGSIGFIYQY